MTDISFSAPVSPWANPAVVDRLKELWSTHSASQIVGQLFNEFRVIVTRSGVVGKLHRLGIGIEAKTNLHPMTRDRIETIDGQIRPRIRRSRAPLTRKPAVRHESPELKAMRCAEITPLGLTLLELEHGQCRYPYGETGEGTGVTFCGHPALKDRSYCSAHFALSVKPTKGISA